MREVCRKGRNTFDEKGGRKSGDEGGTGGAGIRATSLEEVLAQRGLISKFSCFSKLEKGSESGLDFEGISKRILRIRVSREGFSLIVGEVSYRLDEFDRSLIEVRNASLPSFIRY